MPGGERMASRGNFPAWAPRRRPACRRIAARDPPSFVRVRRGGRWPEGTRRVHERHSRCAPRESITIGTQPGLLVDPRKSHGTDAVPWGHASMQRPHSTCTAAAAHDRLRGAPFTATADPGLRQRRYTRPSGRDPARRPGTGNAGCTAGTAAADGLEATRSWHGPARPRQPAGDRSIQGRKQARPRRKAADPRSSEITGILRHPRDRLGSAAPAELA